MQQTEPAAVPLRSGTGRWVLITTVLGSGIAFLDSTVVTVALPTIGRELHAGLTDLQWTVTAYMLTLSAVMLVGGSLGDRYGRRLLFVVGVVWFTLASVICGVAPNAPLLVVARAVQGIGGALLTPASLAIIEGTFHGDDRGAAIGAWAGLGGLFGAAGPILGGLLVLVSWRLIFLINVPIAVVAVLIAQRYVPETRSSRARGRLDVPGPVLAVLGLGALTYALIQGPVDGWSSPAIIATFIAGAALLAALALNELRQPDPMLPLGVFRSRQFSGANGATFVVYAALGAVTFLLVVYLQQAGGYSPLAAGAALLPVTFILLVLSSRSGRLAARIGARMPMTLGPIIAGIGMLTFVRVAPGSAYATTVLPGAIIFGAGLVLTVPALTATALGAVVSERAGVASAINNDIARVGSLAAVALIPAVAGVTTASTLHDTGAYAAAFHMGMVICAVLCTVGGVVSFLTIDRGGQVRAG